MCTVKLKQFQVTHGKFPMNFWTFSTTINLLLIWNPQFPAFADAIVCLWQNITFSLPKDEQEVQKKSCGTETTPLPICAAQVKNFIVISLISAQSEPPKCRCDSAFRLVQKQSKHAFFFTFRPPDIAVNRLKLFRAAPYRVAVFKKIEQFDVEPF